MINRHFLVTLSLLVAACGGAPSPDLYVLRAAENTLPAAQCVAKGTLIVARPRIGAEYDSTRIAVLMPNAQLNYFTGANWASPFPEQLRNFMVDAFAQSGRFRYVGRDVSEPGTKSTLTLQIHEANVVYNEESNAPAVHLRMTALLHDASRLRSRIVSINEMIPAAKNTTPDIIRAFNKATSLAAQQIAAGMKSGC